MKKIILIFAVLVLLGTALSSCKSNKPPCPAYGQIETADTGSNN